MPTLAEIVAEGEEAEETYRAAKPFSPAEIGAGDALHTFYAEHGPRLLAVAKAAVEMRMSVTMAQERECAERLDALIRGDAAVRGEEKEEG